MTSGLFRFVEEESAGREKGDATVVWMFSQDFAMQVKAWWFDAVIQSNNMIWLRIKIYAWKVSQQLDLGTAKNWYSVDR